MRLLKSYSYFLASEQAEEINMVFAFGTHLSLILIHINSSALRHMLSVVI